MRIKTNLLRRPRERPASLLMPSERRRKIVDLAMTLLLLASVNVAGMVYFESLSVGDSIWLTLTTITTVGYGDLSPETLGGRITTMVMMYGLGIFLLAQIAGEWIDYRFDRYERMRKGLWTWDMNNHILIINTPDTDGDRYLQILTQQISGSESLSNHPMQIFSPNFPNGLPEELVKQGIALHHGAPEGRGQFEQLNVEKAAYIIVLAVDTADLRSDSITLDILDRLKAFKLQGYVIAECVQDENRNRLRQHGADAVIRPVRAYPELLVRALAAPGTETILEDLFKHEGVHSRRYNVSVSGQTWADIATKIIVNGVGTPMGYLGVNGIVTNPVPNDLVDATALFILVNHDRIPDEVSVAKVIS